ncbi:MAG: sugar phosphate isomerase/epimerase [Planctomycetes bacterium]|nr:sugar phosphate isomerase/epimerase [Planctomycetota bacterium]
MTTRRLGFSFLYFAPRIDARHDRWFDQLARHGYAGAELPVHDATDAELDHLAAATRSRGLGTTAVGFTTAATDPISPDPAIRRAAVAHLGRLCDKAARLGAKVLAGPMHSAYGVFSEQPPTTDERARCVDVLRAAGEHGKRLGVTLAIEPLNRFECYFLNTAADCSALVRAVGHPNVQGTLDTHHAHIEERSVAAAIRASAGTLGHVQLSENHRGTPGTGQIDFAAAIRELDAIGYDGWLVIEAFSRQDPAFGSALRIWRALDDGAESVIAAGAAIVRSAI